MLKLRCPQVHNKEEKMAKIEVVYTPVYRGGRFTGSYHKDIVYT